MLLLNIVYLSKNLYKVKSTSLWNVKFSYRGNRFVSFGEQVLPAVTVIPPITQ